MRLSALAFILLFVPALAYAALININTADSALLQTLPGIGPSKATAIIDYRTQHGPFAQIQDIQNVSGIGPATFANIQALITVGDSSSPSNGSGGSATTTTVTTSPSTPGGSAGTYVPPPSALILDIGTDRVATLEVPIPFSAVVKTKGGAPDPTAEVLWSFGDGSSATGRRVEKTYHHAGTYLVVARARDDEVVAQADITLTARPTTIAITSVSADGITIENRGTERLDLSGWRLLSSTGTFRFPDGTLLLPESRVLFSWAVMNLPVSLAVTLVFPDGMTAVQYPSLLPPTPVAPTQLPPPLASSQEEQTVDYPSGYDEATPAITRTNAPANAGQAIGAPTPANGLAGVGASASVPRDPIPTTRSPRSLLAFMHSGWALGLLGAIALAGGAIMIL